MSRIRVVLLPRYAATFDYLSPFLPRRKGADIHFFFFFC